MRQHAKHVHGCNLSKAMHGNSDEEEEFKCDICNLTYGYKKSLNEHKRLKHNKERGKDDTFECNECSSRFVNEKSLANHKNLKHSDRKMEFTCTDCGKVFNQKNNLTRHQKSHKNN